MEQVFKNQSFTANVFKHKIVCPIYCIAINTHCVYTLNSTKILKSFKNRLKPVQIKSNPVMFTWDEKPVISIKVQRNNYYFKCIVFCKIVHVYCVCKNR